MTRHTWRGQALAVEAWRNSTTRGSRQHVIVAAALILGSAIVALYAYQWSALAGDLRDQQILGRNVLVLTSTDPNIKQFTVDRNSCDALATQADVARAGVLQPAGRTGISQVGPSVAVIRASTSLIPQLRDGPALGSALTESNPGMPARVSTGEFGALDVTWLPEQPRGVDVNSALVLPLDPAQTDAQVCLVVLETYADPIAVRGRLMAALRTEGGAPSVLPAAQLSFDVLDAYRHRPVRWLALVVGVLLAIASGASRWLRSSEASAYRLSGTSPSDFCRLGMLEEGAAAGTLAASATVAGLVLAAVTGEWGTLASILAWVTQAAGVQFVLGVALAAVLAFRPPLSLAKNR